MKKFFSSRPTFAYFTLGLFLFSLLNITSVNADRIRGHLVASLVPVWNGGQKIRTYMLDRPLMGNRRLQKGENPQAECTPPSLAAQVIYRDPVSWSNSLWINIGADKNVAKNSPVVLHGSLIGLVEYVEAKQSRVRLLSDSGLIPSVLALRGESQNRELYELLQMVCERLELRQDLLSKEERSALLMLTQKTLETLRKIAGDIQLARGELQGSNGALWRARSTVLKGIGFHGDSVVKPGDLLVTSGLDGVFPPNLRVAIVTSVQPLKEGAYIYDLEARPTAGSLNDLSTVFVLPPSGG